MMVEPILIGIVAAVVAFLPQLLRALFPSFGWNAPILIFGVAGLAMLIQRFILDRRAALRQYDGLSDLLIHIHSPGEPDSSSRWGLRGVISFALNLFGGPVGPEGAATEFAHALAIRLRPRSSKWFEQRRRSDAGSALAAGIAAAFGAPFAAILAPMELGIGGRALGSALSALTAYVVIQGLPAILPGGAVSLARFDIKGALYGFDLRSLAQWGAIVAITVGAAVLATASIRLIRYCEESLKELFQTQAWIRTFAGGVLLLLVALAYVRGHGSPAQLLESLIWSRQSTGEVALLLLSQLLSLALVLASFGTVGLFWPLFALGGFLGFGLDQVFFQGAGGFGAIGALAGAAALWGGVLGMPLTGAVAAFELTGSPVVLLPCVIAGFGARAICDLIGQRPLVALDLKARGVRLVEGRSASVLDSLFVRDAMVSDHEVVHEQEPVSEIHQRLTRSRYPFLPVTDSQGTYLGLLTADMIEEGWQAQDPEAAHVPLAKLLEAKDLLYRASQAPFVRTVKANERLSQVSGVFGELPCIPVLGDDGRVLGLLFGYSVRLAYEREVARRALALQHQARD
jgi:H+/Cl- antiporter ClcA